MYRWCITLLLPVAVVAAAGCGERSHREPVFPVEGHVLFHGKPAAGAHVVFHSVANDGVAAPRPSGQVDGTGKFLLTTYTAGDGAPAGDYEVTIEQWVSKNDRPAINQLPRRYQQGKASGLRATVTAGKNDLPTFQLSR
jgi:hypothetical protein